LSNPEVTSVIRVVRVGFEEELISMYQAAQGPVTGEVAGYRAAAAMASRHLDFGMRQPEQPRHFRGDLLRPIFPCVGPAKLEEAAVTVRVLAPELTLGSHLFPGDLGPVRDVLDDIRFAHGCDSKSRRAASTRRGCFRCIAIPSQYPASSRLISSTPSAT